MPRLEVKINTTNEAVDWVRTLLAASAREVQMIECPLTSSSGWDWQICLYLPESAALRKVTQLLSPLQRTGLISEPETAIVAETQPDATEGLHRVGRFVILHPDAAYQAADQEILLRLAPRFAFGSGFHPATFLALRLLEQHIVPGMQGLDLGCGSGILSIAMAKLGAEVLALDNDETAVQATQQAIQDNQLTPQQITVQAGSLGQGSALGHWMNGELSEAVPVIAPAAAFDLIVANILARIHITLASDYQRAIRCSSPARLLITAGYTTEFAAEVNAALTATGFEQINCERFEEWVAYAHRLS